MSGPRRKKKVIFAWLLLVAAPAPELVIVSHDCCSVMPRTKNG